jgi:hypothetical protein
MTISDTVAQAERETSELVRGVDWETVQEIERLRREGWTKYQLRLWFDLPAETIERIVSMIEA